MDREMERLMQQAQAGGMTMRADQTTPDKCVGYFSLHYLQVILPFSTVEKSFISLL